MSEMFGSQSSVKILQMITQYKKISAKDPITRSDLEKQMLKELELKLAHFIEKASGQNPLGQRKTLRVETNFNIRYQSLGDFKKAYIKNISGGGLFIETSELCPIGTQITLELLLPDEIEPISLKTEVAWTNPKKLMATPQGLGVKFIDLSESHRQKIQKLVNMNLEKYLEKRAKGLEPK